MTFFSVFWSGTGDETQALHRLSSTPPLSYTPALLNDYTPALLNDSMPYLSTFIPLNQQGKICP